VVKLECNDCGQEFNKAEGSFYKYELIIWLCDLCAVNRAVLTADEDEDSI